MEKNSWVSSNRAITLISVIITIVVTLILLGVGTKIVVESDLIGNTEDTVNITNNRVAMQQGRVDELVNIYDSIVDTQESPELVGSKVNTETNFVSQGQTAVIPAGFTISGLSSENTIEGGLVIYLINDKTSEEIATINWNDAETVAELQKKYDQFVWVPIKNTTDPYVQDINDMYICQNKGNGSYGTDACVITVVNDMATCTVHGNCTNMAGRLYASSTSRGFEKAYTEVYTEGAGLREPDVILGDDGTEHDAVGSHLSILNTILGTNYTTADQFKAGLQTEYNEIVKSVYENQGFYISRYEISNIKAQNNISARTIAGAKPTGSQSGINWYYMYAQLKDYANNNSLSVGSSMMQGAAYDQVMKFVATNTYNINKSGHAAHSLTQGLSTVATYQTGGLNYPAPTESNESTYVPYTDVSKNIYDLEGNVSIWTSEADEIHQRTRRGGHFNSGVAASGRGGAGAIYANPEKQGASYIGSLMMLYP